MIQWLLTLPNRIMSYFVKFVTFYFFVIVYSIKHVILYYYHSIVFPKYYHQPKTLSVPPPCLTDETFGQHQYAKLKRSKFHYVEKGDKNNRLLVLIHGYPEFWYSWRYQLQRLSQYYWVVAIDMKGYGDSDKPQSRNEYTIDVLVQELHDFLNAIGRQKCTLVTHGQGGLLAWNFINQFPDIVENYVSISSPHPLSYLQEMDLKRVPHTGWHYFCQLPFYPEKEVMKQDLAIFDKVFAKMLSNKRGNITREDIDAFKYTFSRTEDWIGPINYYRTLMQLHLNGTKPMRKSLVPTLFILGNADPYTSLEMICKSSEYVDNFTLKIVEGGGHFLQQEMPNYVNTLILDFLRSPEIELPEREIQSDRSIIKKVFGAGKNVVSSTVNYGNQMWSNSLDVVSRGVSIPANLSTNSVFMT